MPSPRLPTTGLSHVSFSPANRLYTEEHFLKALKPIGVTRRGFRSLCRALRVPMLHVGEVRLIDHLTFCIALRAVFRLRDGDFLVPGCTTLRKNRRRPDDRTELDATAVRRDLNTIIAELIAARRLVFAHTPAAFADEVRKAATTLIDVGLDERVDEEERRFSNGAGASNPIEIIPGMPES